MLKTITATALVLFLMSVISSRATAADKEVCDIPADLALGLEDYSRAVRLHRQLLSLHPNDALAHYHLGFAYGMMGRDVEEVDEYLAAVKLGLRRWDLYLNLGQVYVERHELAGAAAFLETATRLGPERAETHLNLAIVYEGQHRFGDALRQITISRHLAPEDLDVTNANAIICVENGDVACAQDLWTHLAQTTPNYAPALTNLAILRRWLMHIGQSQHDTESPYSQPQITASQPPDQPRSWSMAKNFR
jgi:Flp pilus assembly protein TadD